MDPSSINAVPRALASKPAAAVEQLERGYLVFTTLFHLLFWVPVIYEVYRVFGLSSDEIFTIQSHYYFAFIFCEIPTGYLSDRLPRRYVILAAAIVAASVNVLPILAPNMSGFWLHFIGIALARSLVSGSLSAYLYDELIALGQASAFATIEGRARSASLAARLGAWSSAGLLFAFDPRSLFVLSGIAGILAIAAALWLLPHDNRPISNSSSADHANTTPRRVWSLSLTPALSGAMLQGLVVFVLMRLVMVNLFQPVLSARGFAVVHYGYLLAAATAFEAFTGSVLLPRLHRRWRTPLIWCAMLPALYLAIGLVPGKTATLVSLLGFGAVCGIALPLQKQAIHEALGQSSRRATWLSLESMLDRVICGLAVIPIADAVAQASLPRYFALTTAVGFVTIVIASMMIAASSRGNTEPPQ